ncbi:receptor-interacting serine/threonine-protein kinase 3 [Centropristis striata]|uniref:receptor-interacting serine/threonine-protein kinase 3 n=1 Tax=Centropristis striata TaxID=184440 RepID=UPI0027DF5131|nr:receptor-interacting serine/threonine-protein kinase 3 [Centropristis striata]
MALSSFVLPAMIDDSSLEGWKVIGSGGFGQVYKARHRIWGSDVAIKLLHYDNGNNAPLQREIDMMRQGSSPHVIQVRGVFRGRPPSGQTTQLGLVMEFMERGSLASLQETLHGAPPWPLVFRLAHQVALGINFLHTLSPALLHLDLKPSNVLLDLDLNAKLTDFGLARVYNSVTRPSKKDSEEGGTISYMPPEAFTLGSYSPTRASDIYSYGILLWSMVTGKQPYANARPTLVQLRIPEGDRPPLEEIRAQAAGLAGLTTLMELMVKCWDKTPDQRPTALECATVVEDLYKMHKYAINEAVYQVRKKLDEKEEEGMIEQVERVHITQTSVSEDVGDNTPTGRPPIQEMAGSANLKDKARFKDAHSSRPANEVRKSSVCPIRSSPPPPSTEKPLQGKAAKNTQRAFKEQLSSQYQRQFSSPNTPTCCNHNTRGRDIHLSNVTGFQHGDNNTMHIQLIDSDRRRHPTAPSRVNLPPQQPGSWKDKTGGAG